MIDKRFKCPACGYPMRVIGETENDYQCYFAGCKFDRYVSKYSLKEFKRDIERGKAISNDLILDIVDRTISENKELKQREKTLTGKIDRLLYQRDRNEEQTLKIMSYLHDNYYDLWEEVNKECYLK